MGGTIAESVLAAIAEQVDLVDLATDDIPNREQKVELMKEGLEAGYGLIKLFGVVSKDDLDEALIFAGIANLGKVCENKKAFADGSSIKVTLEAVAPNAPPE